MHPQVEANAFTLGDFVPIELALQGAHFVIGHRADFAYRLAASAFGQVQGDGAAALNGLADHYAGQA